MPKTCRGTGFKAAKVGATIGARFGPYGIITGGVLGYLAGVVVDEMLDD
ncbi:complement resistance protein TraT [Vibrio parahaemolyticus]|nr:complement resistance protein TraT [Vibrio parahaemolyticus]MDG2622732.1 complement resistance protein TraT [Vibrio parahaemolyticus]